MGGAIPGIGGGGGGGGGQAGGAGGAANAASQQQLQQSDQQQAETIKTQMMADAQKQQMQRWKIMQDTQTKIFEITQDVTINKAKTADKMFNQVDSYIRQ